MRIPCSSKLESTEQAVPCRERELTLRAEAVDPLVRAESQCCLQAGLQSQARKGLRKWLTRRERATKYIITAPGERRENARERCE